MKASLLAARAAVGLCLGLTACAATVDSEGSENEEEALFGAKALGPDPSKRDSGPCKYPIVLAHGFNASPTNHWGFHGVAKALRDDGHLVHVAIVPPYDSVAVRADALAGHIDATLAKYGAQKVNIIAHSMGGLDARDVISRLGYGDRIASLTTISTPHNGSAIADFALKVMPSGADKAIDALASVWGLTFSKMAGSSHVEAALESLSEKNAPAFNAAHPDDPNVYYASWAGVSSIGGIPNPKDGPACDGKFIHHKFRFDKLDPQLAPIAPIVAHGTKLRPNDGMATVASAHHGEFRGCYPADHLDEVGQINDKGTNSWTGFNYMRFYRNVAYDLSDMGL